VAIHSTKALAEVGDAMWVRLYHTPRPALAVARLGMRGRWNMVTNDAEHSLLFGLLSLEWGLIHPGILFAALSSGSKRRDRSFLETLVHEGTQAETPCLSVKQECAARLGASDGDPSRLQFSLGPVAGRYGCHGEAILDERLRRLWAEIAGPIATRANEPRELASNDRGQTPRITLSGSVTQDDDPGVATCGPRDRSSSRKPIRRRSTSPARRKSRAFGVRWPLSREGRSFPRVRTGARLIGNCRIRRCDTVRCARIRGGEQGEVFVALDE
jgi:hypothetical protein